MDGASNQDGQGSGGDFFHSFKKKNLEKTQRTVVERFSLGTARAPVTRPNVRDRPRIAIFTLGRSPFFLLVRLDFKASGRHRPNAGLPRRGSTRNTHRGNCTITFWHYFRALGNGPLECRRPLRVFCRHC
jgi:hypothetical protein